MEVGDIVRVKSYMKEGRTEEIYYNSEMDRYKNKTFKIRYVFSCSGITRIKLGNLDGKEDHNLKRWNWLEKWLEPVAVRIPVEELL